MKYWKRCAGLLLCLALALPVFVSGAEEDGQAAVPSLNTRQHLVYINGKGASRFAPDEGLTRAEAAKIIFSLLEDPSQGSADLRFSDVDSGDWFSEPVDRLASLGILHGYEDGTFRPGGAVSRAEFVAMLSRFTSLSGETVPFGDVPRSHWAWEAITSFAARGWVSGDREGLFHPERAITRAEAVTILNAVLGRDASAPETMSMLHDRHAAPFADVRPSDWYYAAVMEAATEHTYALEGGQERWTGFSYKPSGFEPGIQILGGIAWLVDENCQLVFPAPGFQQLGDRLCYVNEDGSILAEAGPAVLGGELYCIREDASVVTDTVTGSFIFLSDGRYTSGNEDLDRLVKQTIAGCTAEGMTRYEKLSACYVWLRDRCTYLSRPHYGRGTTDWAEESAVFLLENGKGNCYCYAAAFAYLARQLGYDAQPVSGGMGVHNEDHAWVMIDGRIFDPEIEYAHLYRYRVHRYYDCFDVDPSAAPFIYHFPT